APAPVAALMPGVFAAARDGEFAAVDPALAELIGRGPAAFRTELERAWAT
ncbi:SDR family NAD(P)-dependent oxidoreductase, partial [Streptomyces sp. SID69]|nr:SDR family NAD(P)-dependent oxidoreductase [Streptomyces sp. SID69]